MSPIEVRTSIPEIQRREIEKRAKHLGFDSAGEYLARLYEMEASGELHLPSEDRHDIKHRGPKPELAHKFENGDIYLGDSALLMLDDLEPQSVDLVMTSPPFGLVRKKSYGNEDADDYVDWFEPFAKGIDRVLKESGSLVLDLGGAWKKGIPSRSIYQYELLTRLCRGYGFHLAQEFFWWNPAKLPLPAEWVNVRRVRVKDSINCVWWLSKTPYPKVSNKRVLQPYKSSTLDMFRRGSYNSEKRSGGHKPSEESFLKDNSGGIPHNMIAIANTKSRGEYRDYCEEHDLEIHPAQFPTALPAFFIRMLTDKKDVVLDPFAGSCNTGAVAGQMGRSWICCEINEDYVKGAKSRFNKDGGPTAPNFAHTRQKPYEIDAPYLSILSEDDSPLVQDGGRLNPRKRRK